MDILWDNVMAGIWAVPRAAMWACVQVETRVGMTEFSTACEMVDSMESCLETVWAV